MKVKGKQEIHTKRKLKLKEIFRTLILHHKFLAMQLTFGEISVPKDINEIYWVITINYTKQQ